MDKILLAAVLLLIYFYTVTCTFFAVQIAALKGRRRRWGWLGFLLGLVGVIIVCFLPNAKGVSGETNPIKAVFRKLTAISPVAVWILVAGLIVVAGGSLLGNHLTTYLENRAHERELNESVSDAELLTPAEVGGKVADIFCGNGCNFAVTESGDLYGWGEVGMTALDESGKIYQKVKKIAAAGDVVYLLATDGTLYAKGDNKNSLIFSQKDKAVASFVKLEEKVRDMALSETVGAILKENGNLYVVGVNAFGQLGRDADRVADTDKKMAEKVQKVVVTGRSLYYLTEDGAVYGVGNNAYGQFGLGDKDARGVPTKLTADCKDLAAGEDFLLVLKKDGTVWSAGNNCFGQLGREVGDAVKEEAEEKKDEAEQKDEAEEEKPAVPENAFGQVENLAEVIGIDAAGRTAFAQIGAEIYGWGQNHLGQLGKDNGNTKTPAVMYSGAAKLAAGGSCTLLLTEDGSLLGAGDGRNYQLGVNGGNGGFHKIAEVKD